jgi:hypothetical protein
MENQEKRIDKGIESGALRPAESARLEAQQAKIKQSEARDRDARSYSLLAFRTVR